MIVKYSKKFPYAPYLNEDIGFEMQVDAWGNGIDEEKVMEGLYRLKAIAEKFHNENNPQLQHEVPFVYSQDPLPLNGTIPHVQPMPSIDRKAIERLEILIDDSQTTDEIRQYQEEARRLGIFEYWAIKHQNLKQ